MKIKVPLPGEKWIDYFLTESRPGDDGIPCKVTRIDSQYIRVAFSLGQRRRFIQRIFFRDFKYDGQL